MSTLNGILLYTPEDAARNRWFIEQLCMYAESENLSLRLCLTNQPETRKLVLNNADFIVNRSRTYIYSAIAQNVRHIPCFNSAEVTGITNEKYMTYCCLHGEHGIPMAKTWQFRKNMLPQELQYPLVAKPADGHGGEGVAWIADSAALEQYAAAFDAAHTEPAYPFLLQEPVVTGWDVRVYILGGEIYAAVLRTSAADFRSNFSLGGHAALFTPDSDMQALVSRVQQIMPLDFAGVDILRHPDGGYVLGEIEDAVGCRMLYQLTERNPAKDYMHLIAERLKSGSAQ